MASAPLRRLQDGLCLATAFAPVRDLPGHLLEEWHRLRDRGKVGNLVSDAPRLHAVRIVAEDALERAPESVDGGWPTLKGNASANRFDPPGVVRLVGEQRDNHHRDSRGEPQQCRAEAAVSHHGGGMGHHLFLRPPPLNVNIRRDGPDHSRIVRFRRQ